MPADFLPNLLLSGIFIAVGTSVYLIIRWFQDHFAHRREQHEAQAASAKQYREYVAGLEERNRILEHSNEEQRQEIHRLICEQLQFAHERKITNGRLKLLANELRADDNSRMTKILKPADLQRKVNLTNRTMNLAICHECLEGRPQNCSGECDSA